MSAVLMLVAASTVVGDEVSCDNGIKPLEGDLGYQWRSNSGVCEGLYEAKVSASLEIVSYLANELEFDPALHHTLSVSVQDIAQLTSTEISLRAVALDAGTYYRMDTKLEPLGQVTWALSEVIAPAKFQSSQLGLFGWYGPEYDKTFVPLLVNREGTQENTDLSSYELKIRPTVDVEYIHWRAWTDDEEFAGEHEIKSKVRAGWPFSIFIDRGPQTVLNVEVNAKEANRENWIPIRLRVARTR